MSIISGDVGLDRQRHFWRRLANLLDAHFIERSRRAVPAPAFRRSKHDIERCRRLVHKSRPAMPAAKTASARVVVDAVR
jgi:hypothetical protein